MLPGVCFATSAALAKVCALLSVILVATASVFLSSFTIKLRAAIRAECLRTAKHRQCAMQAMTQQSFNTQGCFAIDYDFATHRCYFFLVNVLQIFVPDPDDDDAVVPAPFFVHCIINAGVPQPGSQGLRPYPSVVHITLCELSRCDLYLTMYTGPNNWNSLSDNNNVRCTTLNNFKSHMRLEWDWKPDSTMRPSAVNS